MAKGIYLKVGEKIRKYKDTLENQNKETLRKNGLTRSE